MIINLRDEGLFIIEGWSQLRGWMKVEMPYCNIPSRCFIRHWLRQTAHSPGPSPLYISLNTLSLSPLSPLYTLSLSYLLLEIVNRLNSKSNDLKGLDLWSHYGFLPLKSIKGGMAVVRIPCFSSSDVVNIQ